LLYVANEPKDIQKMLKNFFSVAIRHLLIHKYYSAINIAGLAVALAAFLLIGLYVMSEFSYDRHHPDSARIYRIDRDFILRDEDMLLPGNAAAVGPLLNDTFSEVEDFTRIFPRNFRVSRGEQIFYEDQIRMVDANHFDFFAYTWLQGDPATALAEPFSLVLTESLARKYFGDSNPLGETLVLEESFVFKVTGLIQDIPANTHITASAFASISSMPAIEGEDFFASWDINNFHTYLRMAPGFTYDMLDDAFTRYLIDTMPDREREKWQFTGFNVADIHLHSPNRREELSPLGNLTNLRALILIGLGLLTIACINFVNITTANSTRRGKEVALRKTVGSGTGLIMQQFFAESMLQIVLAVGIALPMVELLLPLLAGFTGKKFALSLLGSPQGILLLLGSALFLALCAGFYPAFHLARLRPVQILRGQQVQRRTRLPLRSLLVIFQFAVSIALLIATSIIVLQLKLGREIELGFSKDRVLVLESMMRTGFAGTDQQTFGIQWPAFKNELLSHPGISHVSRSNIRPFNFADSAFFRPIRYEGSGDDELDMTVMFVDFDFFETYEVDVLAGRTFAENFGGDLHTAPAETDAFSIGTYIINEAAAQRLGWTPESAVGKWLNTPENRIVGVVENMKMESVRQPVKPIYYYVPAENVPNDARPFASLRLTGEGLPGTLAFIDATWRKFFPEEPIRRSFLDTSFEALYRQDTQFGNFIGLFSLLTVCISCLGLHGLATFNAQRRTKEIGVRKVMGGSVWSIVLLLTNDFSKLVLIANLIAWPVAYFAMERWLQNFAYRIDLTPLVFIGSGLIALCIAWVTVGSTAAKAANAKPVLALRYE
jgi:putative ABC transport system permease protein